MSIISKLLEKKINEGASSYISDWKGTAAELKDWFIKAQEVDKAYAGDNPYSGGFSTVEELKFEDKTFDSKKEAIDYILNNAEKWHYLLAVKLKDGSFVFGGWLAE